MPQTQRRNAAATLLVAEPSRLCAAASHGTPLPPGATNRSQSRTILPQPSVRLHEKDSETLGLDPTLCFRPEWLHEFQMKGDRSLRTGCGTNRLGCLSRDLGAGNCLAFRRELFIGLRHERETKADRAVAEGRSHLHAIRRDTALRVEAPAAAAIHAIPA